MILKLTLKDFSKKKFNKRKQIDNNISKIWNENLIILTIQKKISNLKNQIKLIKTLEIL